MKRKTVLCSMQNPAELITYISQAKTRAGIFCMTNGCFDLMHWGHLEYLRFCSQYGSNLVVALNSDESVERLKGEGHPINPINERVKQLTNLVFVSCVVVFNEEQELKTAIEIVKPAYYVKDEYYKTRLITGQHQIRVNNGRLIYCKRYPISSSDIIDRIVERFGKDKPNG